MGTYFWWEERESAKEEEVLSFEEKDRIGALVWQIFGMWEGKVAVAILTGLTSGRGAEVTTSCCNELWDIETGTKQAGKTVKRKGS